MTGVENTIKNVDAWEGLFAADFAFFGGVGGSVSVVFLNKGDDPGIFFYRTADMNIGYTLSGGFVGGPILYNKDSKVPLDRNLFAGWSTNMSGGAGPVSAMWTRGYTDGQMHFPGLNFATTAYSGVFVGTGVSSFKLGATLTFSNSAIINSWSISRKK